MLLSSGMLCISADMYAHANFVNLTKKKGDNKVNFTKYLPCFHKICFKIHCINNRLLLS